MYRSLHGRLLELDDEVEVWPGHLGGSLCGGSGLDLKTSSTIGFERRHNAALGIADEAEFVEDAVGKIGDKPPNVERIVNLNRGPLIEHFGTPQALTPHEVEEAVANGACVIDGRTNEEFDESHIAGALSTSSYDTGFATKVCRVAPAGSRDHRRRRLRLRRAPRGRAAGRGRDAGARLPRGRDDRLAHRRPPGRADRADRPARADAAGRGRGRAGRARRPAASEYRDEHIPGSLHIPYGDLAQRLDELPRDRPMAAICRGGKRSGLAASILQREGFADVIHVGKGVGAWRAAGGPVESGDGRRQRGLTHAGPSAFVVCSPEGYK